jgi:hypothetical protein
MRAIISVAVGILFLISGSARADLYTITYSGTVNFLNYYPYRYVGAPDYDGLLGSFTLITYFDTSTGALTQTPDGFSFTAGFAPLGPPPGVGNSNIPLFLSDYALLYGPSKLTQWGYYGVTTTMTATTISQKFVALAGGPGYWDNTLPYLEITASLDGSSGGGDFLIDPGAGTGIGIYGDLTIDSVAIAAVPEQSTWAMLLIGFAAIGFASRHLRIPNSYAGYCRGWLHQSS